MENLTNTGEVQTCPGNVVEEKLRPKKQVSNIHIEHAFAIKEHSEHVELLVTGELTGVSSTVFRSKIIELLKHGRSRAYRVDLSKVSALDDQSFQLILSLHRELSLSKTEFSFRLPENHEARIVFERAGYEHRKHGLE